VNSGGTDYQGVSLASLINEASVASPGDHQYKIIASDGWSQTVTWENIQDGIIIEDQTMTAFPGLPGKYRIRDVVEIQTVEADTLLVNEKLYVWKQVFHIIDDPITMIDSENNTLEGVYLSAVINITEVPDKGSRSYDLIGSDGYNKTVSWDDMLKGILVESEMKCYFPHLSKKFHISDIVEIEVI
jgi:hypothetical protein